MRKVNYIFYPITPLKCFSNKQAFIKLKRRSADIEELKKTRAIAKKIEEE